MVETDQASSPIPIDERDANECHALNCLQSSHMRAICLVTRPKKKAEHDSSGIPWTPARILLAIYRKS